MAYKIIKKPEDYLSETAYVYDIAQTSQYFDKSVYEGLNQSGDRDAVKNYIYAIAGAKDKDISASFNKQDYDYLKTPEDKATYTILKLHGDENSQEYKDAMKYLDQQIQAGIDEEIFNSLNGFEKTVSTVGGVVGNALNSVYGMVESMIDVTTLAVGGIASGFGANKDLWKTTKEAAAWDLTGTGAIAKGLADYSNKYTYIGKNNTVDFINNVVAGIAQYSVNLIPVVGPVIYWYSTAGSFAKEAVESKPEIDFLSLLTYTAAGTGLAVGVEKLSSFALGGTGSFIDKITSGGKVTGLTKFGEWAGKSWVTKVLGDGISEGLEESIEEFADTVLWNAMIAQGDSDLRKKYSFQEILYAGIVGGTIGALMGGGRIAATSTRVQTADGRIMTKQQALDQKLEIKQEFTKTQSLKINEQLSTLSTLTKTSSVADLRQKYSKLNEETVKTEHAKEYEKAVKKDEKIAKQMVEAIGTLSKIHSALGDAEFKKIADLASATYENIQRLADNYVAKSTGTTEENRKVEQIVRDLYPGYSFIISDSVPPVTQRLFQNLYNKFGIKAYLGDVGAIPGHNQKLSLTIADDTIIFDPQLFGDMSEQEILNTVVKEELVHSVQFVKNVITPETLLMINLAMGNDTDLTKQNVEDVYGDETPLTKLTEAQAKAVAEVLLFDQVTVSKMFYTQYSTFNKFYKFLRNIRMKIEESKELRSQKGKMKYNQLLKSMKMYRDIASEKLGTAENVEQFIKDYQITESEQKQLRDSYLENPNIGPIEGYSTTVAFAKARKPLSQEAREVLYNENGTPKTFYKGTNIAGITQFDSTKGEKVRQTGATWLTDSLEVAKSYANEKQPNAMIYSVDVSKIENPKILDAEGKEWRQAFGDKSTDQIVEEAIAENKGYDAVIIKNVIDPGTYSTSRELLKPATDIAIIDNSKINIINEESKTPTVTLEKADGTGQLEFELETIKEKIKEKPYRRNKVRKFSEGIQLSVFDSIDPNMSVKEREDTRLRASQEELPLNQRPPKQSEIDKANKIKELCSELSQSEYQGDVENHKFASVTNEIFEKDIDLFKSITPDEWQMIRRVLLIDSTDPRASAALNVVTRYGYLHRGSQFATISNLIKTTYANAASSAGQFIGLTSHDYGNHSVQSFITELSMKNGVKEIPIPMNLILKAVPEFKSVEDFQKSLIAEIEDLNNRARESKDAYVKWDLNRQASVKERVLSALADGDVATAIDEQLSQIIESNENVTENLKRQNDTYKAIIEWLLANASFERGDLKGFSETKVPLNKNLEKAKKFFEGLESFRYLMMLSNPATALKNAISNTLILGQTYVEDLGTKILENKSFLTQAEKQVKYTGEYDSDFAKWVNDNYLEKIKADAEGDKYTSSELRRLQQQYAEEKSPIKKSKVLDKISQIEKKLLSDKWWVTKRTLQNLTNTLAGSSNLILSDARSWLVSKYRGNIKASDMTNEQLINNIAKTNKQLATLTEQALTGDKVAIMDLATKLNLDIISPDLKKQSSIYYHSFYRANKTFFKIDNWFTRTMNNLNKKHPAAAYVVRHFIPFVRVTANSTAYIIDRSPIGLAKGLFKAFQTKTKWNYQMRTAIENYYREQYVKTQAQNNADFVFNQTEFDNWLSNINNTQLQQALNGDNKILKKVFDEMATQGLVNSGLIGSDNLYARAEVMEQISQGITGTAIMTIGILLASITDAFDYDDEELYGPVVKIGDIKIELGELSPFSTMFTIGAMLGSDKLDNKFDAIFNIFADATILSTLDSALSYSDGVWDYLKNQSVNIVAQYQPAITKAMTKLIYNSKKDKTGSWGIKLLKTLGANSLLFNYLVPNKINPYTGEPEKYYDTGWFEALFDISLPIGVRVDGRSDLEKEADLYGAKTTGLSGSFTINGVDYKLTNKDKEEFAKYKAEYVNNHFENIKSGEEKVTILDKNTNKYKTVKYSELSDEEKQRVLKNLYSNSTEITKIKYWLDQGNYYYTTDKDQYLEYKKLFGNSARIVYKKKWSKSKFVEGK